jgi:hypothetical protein
LRHIEQFDKRSSNETITYKIDEQDADLFKYSLNPDHTHFILVDDNNMHIKLLKFRVALEKRLQKPLLCRKSKRPMATSLSMQHTNENKSSSSSASFNLNDLAFITTANNRNKSGGGAGAGATGGQNENEPKLFNHEYDKIPIVCLLIGGGVGSISLVLTKIYQGIPVLTFKGKTL